MNALDQIAGAVRRHGLHKLAARVVAAEGLPAPEEWTMPEVGRTLGTKLAQDRLAHQSIMAGLGSLHEVAGGIGEKTARDGLYHEFSRVKFLGERLGKTASAEVAEDLTRHAVGFWQRCKRAAANDPDGEVLGLAKLALSFLAAAEASGEKTAASGDEAVQFAASFACAAVVDDAIARMVKAAEVTPAEGIKLAALNAEAALNDLRVLTRVAEKKADALDTALPSAGALGGGLTLGTLALLLSGTSHRGRRMHPKTRNFALTSALLGAAGGGAAGYGVSKLRHAATNALARPGGEKKADAADMALPALGALAGGVGAGGFGALLGGINDAEGGLRRMSGRTKSTAALMALLGGAAGGIGGYGLNELRRALRPQRLPDTATHTDRTLRSLGGDEPYFAILSERRRGEGDGNG